MKLLAGVFDLKNGQLRIDNTESFTYQNDQVQLYAIGKIRCDDNETENDGELLARALLQYQEEITNHLRGIYIMVGLNKLTNVLYILQDSTSSPIMMYYAICDQKLNFSTSLKTLLIQTRIPAVLNTEALEEFFYNGFINNKQTLLKNVFKIEIGHILRVDKNGIEEINAKYNIPEITEEEGVEAWDDTLDAAISRAMYGMDSAIFMPLSQGYDSNYILNTIRRKSDVKVKAFCVGAVKGRNEIPAVEENILCYQNIDLITGDVDHSAIDQLPDIVWRTEGAVFERGLFLQYTLAQLVKAHGGMHLICGECADQTMNRLYYEGRKRNSIPGSKTIEIYTLEEDPFYIGNLIVLKKNGILMNSFDIDTHYPFLDDEFVAVAKAVRAKNDISKVFHKQRCNSMLPPKIVERLKKIGGATDYHSIFTDHMCKVLWKYIKNSDICRQYYPVYKQRKSIRRYISKYFVQLCRFFTKKVISTVANRPLYTEHEAEQKYYAKERDMGQLSCLLYLELFYRLFCSGQYDTVFHKHNLEMDFEQVTGCRLHGQINSN
jgi:asparagine synthetase B (glutamine-hydrolysing)